MSAQKKKMNLYPLHLVIGFGIIALFWLMPPIAPITELGMKCVGAFIGMVYLWSLVDTMWPSMVGLFMLAISGIGGDAGFNGVWMQAVGVYTVLLTLFAMVLFGAMDEVGDTKYIAKWFLTRKVFKGRPIVFLAIFYVTCFVISAICSPITGLIILWPIALSLMDTLGITREDRIWPFFFVGMFVCMTLAQPLFPFLGAQLIPYAAFQSMTAAMGNAMTIPMGQYMAVDLIMTALVMAIYIIGVVFVLRVDISKLKAVDPEMVEKQMPLPKMNFQQKCFLYMIPLYLLMILIPNFIKGNPVSDALNFIGPMGITLVWIMLFLIVRWNGKPLLDFKEVAYKQFNWGIFFMIAAAVYGANTLSNEATGVPAFLIQALTPILGGRSEMVFVAIMFTTALIITNFANNAAMAVVLMPVVLNFSNQMGINPMPVATGVILMVFVAMLTPAASPHAGLMHGMKNIYTTKEILSIGFPVCIITLILYIFIGYPLCKMLMGV
ncbi:MAG: SLC13 family permease [Peptococcaceae bacterium]|nr:SLC13 family permease [Peptococcaceae bacterium]